LSKTYGRPNTYIHTYLYTKRYTYICYVCCRTGKSSRLTLWCEKSWMNCDNDDKMRVCEYTTKKGTRCCRHDVYSAAKFTEIFTNICFRYLIVGLKPCQTIVNFICIQEAQINRFYWEFNLVFLHIKLKYTHMLCITSWLPAASLPL